MQLLELLKLSGVKQATLANAIGVKQASISEWANGKKEPKIDALIAIARYFHVSVGCVVGEEPIPSDYPNHWPPKPLQAGDPIPAYIGGRQIRYFPPDAPIPPGESIFTDEQIKAINGMISARIEALREDTSSLKDTQDGKRE